MASIGVSFGLAEMVNRSILAKRQLVWLRSWKEPSHSLGCDLASRVLGGGCSWFAWLMASIGVSFGLAEMVNRSIAATRQLVWLRSWKEPSHCLDATLPAERLTEDVLGLLG